MKFAFYVLSVCLITSPAFASTAQILASDADNQTVAIGIDAEGTPRVNGEAKTYPTIKDFREESDFHDACYKGTVVEAKALLTALVDAANGDGDSWAELVSIKSQSSSLLVTASITDEGGEREEDFTFAKCQ